VGPRAIRPRPKFANLAAASLFSAGNKGAVAEPSSRDRQRVNHISLDSRGAESAANGLGQTDRESGSQIPPAEAAQPCPADSEQRVVSQGASRATGIRDNLSVIGGCWPISVRRSARPNAVSQLPFPTAVVNTAAR